MGEGKTKPIGKIETGDKVEAANPKTGKHRGPRTVIATWINHDHDLIDLRIRLANGHTKTLRTTSEHPFRDATTGAWVPAGRLKPGHALTTENGHTVRVATVRPHPGAANRYNLTVAQLHTYYVVAGGVSILVHNTCGPGGPDDAALAQQSAQDLQELRHSATNDHWMAGDRGTTAVIAVRNTETNTLSIRTGINGGGEAPDSWPQWAKDSFVQAGGHAEEGIINSMAPNEVLEFGGTSRNICEEICYPLMNQRGIVVGGPKFPGAADKSPWRMFWTDPMDPN